MPALGILDDRKLLSVAQEERSPFFVVMVSPDCVLCKEAEAHFEEAALKFSSKIKGFSLNINENALWRNLSIRAVPTVLYIKEGCVLARHDGLPDAHEIEDVIERIITKEFDYRIRFFRDLKRARYAEERIYKFYAYIAEQTRNGKIRAVFQKCSEESSIHHKELERIFSLMGGEIRVEANDELRAVAVEPESFSLLGALKSARELEERAVNFYHTMLKSIPEEDQRIKESIKRILKEENTHMTLLKKEEDYLKFKEFDESMNVSMSSKEIKDLFI